MTLLAALLGIACTAAPAPIHDSGPQRGTAEGTAPLEDDAVQLVGGLAYRGSGAHPDAVVVRLTSWEAASCELRSEGEAMEFPADRGPGQHRASWWRCTDRACATIDHPVIDLQLDRIGDAVGERIEGSVAVLDDADQPVGEVAFDVPFCGELR